MVTAVRYQYDYGGIKRMPNGHKQCEIVKKGLVEGKCLGVNCVAEGRTAANHEHCLNQANIAVHPAGAALSCFINVKDTLQGYCDGRLTGYCAVKEAFIHTKCEQ
ncbi:hypothetical protein Ddc_10274 [Ditylenchus destructor]|nr:hypothetical protein Ddc_10274 [Ditylenchus destructor]